MRLSIASWATSYTYFLRVDLDCKPDRCFIWNLEGGWQKVPAAYSRAELVRASWRNFPAIFEIPRYID